MFEGKGEFLRGTPHSSETVNPEFMRTELIRTIGRDAVEYPEKKGLSWTFSETKDKYGRSAMSARFQDGNHFIVVRDWSIDLQVEGCYLRGVYGKGKPLSILDQSMENNKTGVEVSFGVNGEEVERGKIYTIVNDELAKGSVNFLRDLVGFVPLIDNNVFLNPTDERRLELYRKFFTSSKFDESFRGTYFLFQPTPTELPNPGVG